MRRRVHGGLGSGAGQRPGPWTWSALRRRGRPAGPRSRARSAALPPTPLLEDAGDDGADVGTARRLRPGDPSRPFPLASLPWRRAHSGTGPGRPGTGGHHILRVHLAAGALIGPRGLSRPRGGRGPAPSQRQSLGIRVAAARRRDSGRTVPSRHDTRRVLAGLPDGTTASRGPVPLGGQSVASPTPPSRSLGRRAPTVTSRDTRPTPRWAAGPQGASESCGPVVLRATGVPLRYSRRPGGSAGSVGTDPARSSQ